MIDFLSKFQAGLISGIIAGIISSGGILLIGVSDADGLTVNDIIIAMVWFFISAAKDWQAYIIKHENRN